MSSIPDSTTTRSTTDLPEWQQPFNRRYMQESFDYYMPGSTWEPFRGPGSPGGLKGGALRQYDGPDRTLLGFNDQEQAAQNAQQQYLSSAPPPGMDMGQVNQFASDTLSGQYLSPDSNPYIKALYESSAGDVTKQYQNGIAPQQAANAAMAGAYGGSASANEQVKNQYGLGQNLSQLASQIYGTNYSNERQNQMQMAQFMPQLGQYVDQHAQFNENFNLNRLDRMNALGANRRQLEQQQQDVGYENQMTRWEYPYKAMMQWGQMLGTGGGGGSSGAVTAPNPNATNAAATYGGLGIAGAGTIFNGYNGYNGG